MTIRHNGKDYRHRGRLDIYEEEKKSNPWGWIILVLVVLMILAKCHG